MMVAKTRLGFVVPSMNYVVEPDIYRSLPDDVSAHFARVLVTTRELDAPGYHSIWEQSNSHLDQAVDELATARVSSIAYAVTGGSFYGGRRWDEDFRAAHRARTGIPVTSTAYALVCALRALGTNRVAVATAYLDHQNANLRRFLTEHGADVLSIAGLGATEVQQPASMAEDDLLAVVSRVNAHSAESVIISCAGLSVLHLIEPLEHELKKPVITSNQAVLWTSMREAGLSASLAHLGQLFHVSQLAG